MLNAVNSVVLSRVKCFFPLTFIQFSSLSVQVFVKSCPTLRVVSRVFVGELDYVFDQDS